MQTEAIAIDTDNNTGYRHTHTGLCLASSFFHLCPVLVLSWSCLRLNLCLSCLVFSSLLFSSLALSCLMMSCVELCCLALPCRTLVLRCLCLVLCLVLSYLSCLVLPCVIVLRLCCLVIVSCGETKTRQDKTRAKTRQDKDIDNAKHNR
jgi:hypothetical protein